MSLRKTMTPFSKAAPQALSALFTKYLAMVRLILICQPRMLPQTLMEQRPSNDEDKIGVANADNFAKDLKHLKDQRLLINSSLKRGN